MAASSLSKSTSPSLLSSYLYQLAPELIQQILYRLPRSSIVQLCLTAQRLYELCLPELYTHLELSFRCQIHQLEMGLHTRPLLRDIVQRRTKQLTIVCRQSGSNMNVDFEKLLAHFLPNVETLTFVDFHVLFTESICQLVHYSKSIRHIQFRYCNLVSTTHNVNQFLSFPMKHIQRLSMVWTDFSDMAMSQLLSCLPDLTMIDLGPNHNRIRTANESALTALTQHCFHLHHLAVSLQHIEEETLCDVLLFYGHHLTLLSIRCVSPRTLDVVAQFCPRVLQLTLQAVHSTTTAGTVGGHQQQRQNRNNYSLAMLQILQQCRHLQSLELSGWLIQDIPSIVWSVVAKQRHLFRSYRNIINGNNSSMVMGHGNSDSSGSVSWHYYLDDEAMLQQQNGDILQYRSVGNLKKTLILTSQELHEIRKSLI